MTRLDDWFEDIERACDPLRVFAQSMIIKYAPLHVARGEPISIEDLPLLPEERAQEQTITAACITAQRAASFPEGGDL